MTAAGPPSVFRIRGLRLPWRAEVLPESSVTVTNASRTWHVAREARLSARRQDKVVLLWAFSRTYPARGVLHTTRRLMVTAGRTVLALEATDTTHPRRRMRSHHRIAESVSGCRAEAGIVGNAPSR
ncbi:hypothetical protein GCM10027199_68840 [Amycolatopsis magusensis]